MSLLDKIFFWRKPKTVVVQKNNVVGGDIVAGNAFVRPVPKTPSRSTTKPSLPTGTMRKEYETKGTPVRRTVEEDTPVTTASVVSPFPTNGYFMGDSHVAQEKSTQYEAPTYIAPEREVFSTPTYVSSCSDYSSSASSSSSDYSSYSCSDSSSGSSSSSSSFD